MPLTRKKLQQLIKDAKKSNDWSKVEHTDVSEIKDMSDLFSECNGIEYLDLSNWDVSNVTSMNSMFDWSDLNNDSISQWDVSNVKNMTYIFYNSRYNQPLNDWNVSSVKNMNFMFKGSKYNQPLNNWNVSNVENMMYMFKESQYNHPLNDWDVSNVEDMYSIFKGSRYNQPLNDWNVSNVEDMGSMFKGSSFSHDISSWDALNVQSDTEDESFGKEYIWQCQEFFAKIERVIDTGIVDDDTDLDGIYEFLKTNESESMIKTIEQRIMVKSLEYNGSNEKPLLSGFKL